MAGDFFDRWNPPSELINFALRSMPEMIGVPGNHDLPCHAYKDIRRSAYWTLVEAGKLQNIEPDCPMTIGIAGKALVLHGFGCGHPVRPLKLPSRGSLALHVAVVHEYLWVPGHGYKDAPNNQRVGKVRKNLAGYDLAVYGDNHSGFDVKRFASIAGKVLDFPHICNVGGFFRRKIDEKTYQPSVGLLHEDGTVSRQYLDCSADKWLDECTELPGINDIGFQSFLESLSELGEQAMDFAAVVHRLLERDKVSQRVKDFVLQALGGKQ